jgi:hypothetical protein
LLRGPLPFDIDALSDLSRTPGPTGLGPTELGVVGWADLGLAPCGESTGGLMTAGLGVAELVALGVTAAGFTAGWLVFAGLAADCEDRDESKVDGIVMGEVDAFAGAKAPDHWPNGLLAGIDELPGLPIKAVMIFNIEVIASHFGALVVPCASVHGPRGFPAQLKMSPAMPANRDSWISPRADQSENETVVHPLYLIGTPLCTSSRYTNAPVRPITASVLWFSGRGFRSY